MEKSNSCILLFLVFLTSFCNAQDYRYDDYNYDDYDYNNQQPEDYTDDYSQETNDYYYQNLFPPPNPPLPPPIPPPPPMAPMECKNYKSLTDSTRKVNVRADLSTKKADRSGNSYTSVDWQGEGWYRVMGGAGTRIPETSLVQKPQLIGFEYCNTRCPGYLRRGSHPQNPGQLVNTTICYKCYNDLCTTTGRYYHNPVKIRHCGHYFVYYLTQTVNENFRYCTE